MFNLSSQDICAANLNMELTGISPYYKAIYGEHVNVWHVAEDGSNQKFCQEDGHIQWVPMSSTISTRMIKPLVEELQQLFIERMKDMVESAHNDPNIPADHSIFHYFQPWIWVDDATLCLPFKEDIAVLAILRD